MHRQPSSDVTKDALHQMNVAHDAKINKYAEITEHTGLQVRPAVFATTGHLHPSTEKLLREISSHAPSAAGAEATTATSRLTTLYTQLSVSIQRDNAKIIADCFRNASVRKESLIRV